MPACCCQRSRVFAERHDCQADLLNLLLLDAHDFLQTLGHIENNRLTYFKAFGPGSGTCWKIDVFDCRHLHVSHTLQWQ